MKKILILTASTGAGHNQVAKTLETALLGLGHEVQRVDFIREQSKVLELLVEEGYDVLASKFPETYGRLYKMSNREWINGRFAKMVVGAEYRRAKQLVLNYQPDLIIGTHTFAVSVFNRLKVKGHYKGPFISVVTDFEAHYAYVSEEVDLYITGSEFTNDSLTEKGIQPDRIKTLGIPVHPKFYKEVTKAKEADAPFTVLLMGGSMGLDPMKKAFENLLGMDRHLKVYVVCGTNKTLKTELEGIVQTVDTALDIDILGFTDNVHELMDLSDVIITKPGGLTVSEALIKKLPMIVPYFIPGQEAENLDFLTLVNIAVEVRDVKRISKIVAYLMDHPIRLEGMKSEIEYISRDHNLDNVISTIESYL
jgi:processive 1,2-diacylglycerol beta-glucosyltransferase